MNSKSMKMVIVDQEQRLGFWCGPTFFSLSCFNLADRALDRFFVRLPSSSLEMTVNSWLLGIAVQG